MKDLRRRFYCISTHPALCTAESINTPLRCMFFALFLHLPVINKMTGQLDMTLSWESHGFWNVAITWLHSQRTFSEFFRLGIWSRGSRVVTSAINPLSSAAEMGCRRLTIISHMLLVISDALWESSRKYNTHIYMYIIYDDSKTLTGITWHLNYCT